MADASVGVLVDAASYYRALADAIDQAEHSILIAGWQVDTRVVLRRALEDDPERNTLYALLQAACARHPNLTVRVLPWSYHAVYLPEREWLTPERIREIGQDVECEWDARHGTLASHHEKVVVIDGEIAFVGGIDLCDDRWDDRWHLPDDPRRVNADSSKGAPYHDMQTVVRGPLVEHVQRSFAERWENACGRPLALPPRDKAVVSRTVRVRFRDEFPLGRGPAALVRTRSACDDGCGPVEHTIRGMLCEAIRRARTLVYIEAQYFTSRAILDAFAERFRDERMPPLEVVMILPQSLFGVLEQAAVDGPQMAALIFLSQLAAERGHTVGFFCPSAHPEHRGSANAELVTYVHAKLVIVDDTFLNIGSANLTNRSMGVDAETNIVWIAETHEERLHVRSLRTSLLAEHAGLPQSDRDAWLAELPIIPMLVQLAQIEASRLVPRTIDRSHGPERTPLEKLLAEIGDPERCEPLERRIERVAGRLVDLIVGSEE